MAIEAMYPLRRLRLGSRDYSPIRVLKPEKKSTRLDQPRGQAQTLRKIA